MKELKNTMLIRDISINNVESSAMIDTWQKDNYTSNKMVRLLKLKPKRIPEIETIVSDGRTSKIRNKLYFDLKLEDFPVIIFRTSALVLYGLQNTLNLGLYFYQKIRY